MHDEESDTLLSLMAELEAKSLKPATGQAITSEVKPVPPPVTLATLPGSVSPVVHEPVPAPTTVETVPIEPAPPLSEHPMVRNLLMMLPYDAQVLLGNVLASSGLTAKRALVLCSILLIAGMFTGYIAVPKSLLDQLQASYKGFTCPVPQPLPPATPVIATPTQ